ncbi:hypothetical protein [Candidatus Tisiphia endosymbiont of Ditula angustiorana]|uniref:hypothetical protein n=1 Tax=Candidatus Tisiphia endosymbiont of Ditula angustiorana TaxID=3066272 RepID=UPI00312C79ED
MLNTTQENSSQQQEATSSAAICQESTLGWSNDNKKLLKTIATLSEKPEDEVVNEMPQDILSDPEYLKDYLTALIESLKINDSCTNDNPLDDVAAGSSQMSSAASCQGCALTGENLPFNEELD